MTLDMDDGSTWLVDEVGTALDGLPVLLCDPA